MQVNTSFEANIAERNGGALYFKARPSTAAGAGSYSNASTGSWTRSVNAFRVKVGCGGDWVGVG